MATKCDHAHLTLTPSPRAAEAGYKQPTPTARLAATSTNGRAPSGAAQAGVGGGKRHGTVTTPAAEPLLSPPTTFPAPLVLEGDDLRHDPKQPPQSTCAFLRDKDRNPVTGERKVVYVARPPSCPAFISKWGGVDGAKGTSIDVNGVMGYLRAFFAPLPVRLFDDQLAFTLWDDAAEAASPPPKRSKSRSQTKAPSNGPEFVGLECPSIGDLVGIRTRADPTGVFPRQLNLNDLLDAAMAMLPEDAYSLLLLVEQDLYEDEADDYCCGRAYGGSRIAVVSSARYQTVLDVRDGVDEGHAWPLSHCASYVGSLCRSKAIKSVEKSEVDGSTPMGAAVLAAKGAGTGSSEEVFLLRVARTASHELGHCFGLEHCVYYACVMQSTASMAEDVRQPPYLCLVCATKLGKAKVECVNQSAGLTGEAEKEYDEKVKGWVLGFSAKMGMPRGKWEEEAMTRKRWEVVWCRGVGESCGDRGGSWKGLGAWCERRVGELEAGRP